MLKNLDKERPICYSVFVNERNPGMKQVGTKIRSERKRLGLTLEELAGRVGVSALTLQRIETGKTSPSVALLSEIAQSLNKSIVSFVEEIGRPPIVIRRNEQQTISSRNLELKVIGPDRMIARNLIVSYGEMKKGQTIDAHSDPAIEWVYVVEGRCEHKLGNESIFLETGDSMSYDARQEHAVIALEKHRFFAIRLKEE